jgi:hypothetical protein
MEPEETVTALKIRERVRSKKEREEDWCKKTIKYVNAQYIDQEMRTITSRKCDFCEVRKMVQNVSFSNLKCGGCFLQQKCGGCFLQQKVPRKLLATSQVWVYDKCKSQKKSQLNKKLFLFSPTFQVEEPAPH